MCSTTAAAGSAPAPACPASAATCLFVVVVLASVSRGIWGMRYVCRVQSLFEYWDLDIGLLGYLGTYFVNVRMMSSYLGG